MRAPMSSRSSGPSIQIAPWLRSCRSEWLRLDALDGLTAAAVVIPKTMAYAAIAGTPVEAASLR